MFFRVFTVLAVAALVIVVGAIGGFARGFPGGIAVKSCSVPPVPSVALPGIVKYEKVMGNGLGRVTVTWRVTCCDVPKLPSRTVASSMEIDGKPSSSRMTPVETPKPGP